MKLLVDGKEVVVNNDVKVIYEDVDEDQEVHATLTHEGLILDTFLGGEPHTTACLMAIELTELCY